MAPDSDVNWPFWAIDRFEFETPSAKARRSLEAVSGVHRYTAAPEVPPSLTAHARLRLQNNVTVLFRALLAYRDFCGTSDFWTRMQADHFGRGSTTNTQAVADAYARARHAWQRHHSGTPNETARRSS